MNELNRAHPLPLFPNAKEHTSRWLYRLRLGRATCRHLYLSHPETDENGEPCRPSPVLEDVFGENLHFETTDAPEMELSVPPESHDRLLSKLHDMDRARHFYLTTDPCFRRDQANEFTGSIATACPAPLRKRLVAFESLSASTLETYATCPFRFLLERIYNVQVPSDVQPDPSPLDTGTAVHEALETFYKPRLGKPLTAYGPDQRKELFACFKAAFEKRSRHWPEERRKLARLKAIRWAEATDRLLANPPDLLKDSVPIQVEASFGMKENHDSPEIPLRTGGTLRLKGRIDRIDRQGTTLVIIDYKTSSDLARYKRHLKVENFLKNAFQAPIYLLSALQSERLRNSETPFENVLFAFLPLGADNAAVLSIPSAAKEQDPFWQTDLEHRQEQHPKFSENNFADRLDNLVQAMRAGDFQVTPMDCTFCEFRAACRIRLMPCL